MKRFFCGNGAELRGHIVTFKSSGIIIHITDAKKCSEATLTPPLLCRF